MGLDLSSITIDEYFQEVVLEGPFAPSRDEFRNLILSAIEEQTGAPVEVSDRTKSDAPELGRFGPYSVIHDLRLFAARHAGYRLEEAYDIPDWRSTHSELVGTESAEENNDTTDAESDVSDDDAFDAAAEFKEEWGAELNTVVPLGERHGVFPFSQFVCFSDSDGLYLPLRFPRPILVRGYYFGSLPTLIAEMTVLGEVLKTELMAALDSGAEVQERHRSYMRSIWWRFTEAAKLCMDADVALVFC